MIIIGVDFHPEYQEIASVNTDTGEYQERRLAHPKEAEEFYRSLSCVGQAACGVSRRPQFFKVMSRDIGSPEIAAVSERYRSAWINGVTVIISLGSFISAAGHRDHVLMAQKVC